MIHGSELFMCRQEKGSKKTGWSDGFKTKSNIEQIIFLQSYCSTYVYSSDAVTQPTSTKNLDMW
jgi:hypothetical protein